MFIWGYVAQLTPVILALRNMRVRWVRTTLTTMGIVLGVAVILAVNVANASTLAAIHTVFDEASGKAHLTVESKAMAGEGFDESVAGRVARMEGVALVAPTVSAFTVPASQARNWTLNYSISGMANRAELQLIGIDPAADPQVRQYKLVAGRLLEPGETDYNVVLVKDWAEEEKLQIGRDLTILVPSGQAELRIVGLISKEGPGLVNNGAVGFVPLRVVQDLFGRGGHLDALDILATAEVANSPARLEALKAQVAARLGERFSVTYPATRGEIAARRLASYQLGLNFFSIVALFVGAFLIYNAFAMTVVERTREIGMLRALGMTRLQTLGLVLTEAVLLGLVGSVLGVGFGLFLARGLTTVMGLITGVHITILSVPPADLERSVLVGIGVTLVAAWLPAHSASRISPLQALQVAGQVDESRWVRRGWTYGPAVVGVSYAILNWVPVRREMAYPLGAASVFALMLGATLCVPLVAGALERLFRPLFLLAYGQPGRLGSANVERAKGRTTLTVAALMVGIAMIIGIAGMTGSFRREIQTWVDTALGGDLYVRSPLRMRLDLVGRIASIEGVAAVSPSRFTGTRTVSPTGNVSEDTLVFISIDPLTYPQVATFQFENTVGDMASRMARLAQGDAVLIGTTVADRYHLKQGDRIRLDTGRGQHDFEVAGIVVDFTGQGLVVYGSYDDLRRYFGLNDADRLIVKLKPGASLDEVKKRITDEVGKSRHLQVETSATFRARLLDLTAQAFSLFDVLALIGIIIAALGVINTMLMNVLERQRELGALRSLGMTRAQVRGMILAEAGTMGLIGGVFGLSFGLVLAQTFVMAIRAINGYVLQYVPPLAALGVGALIAILVSQGAALYPALKASQVNIIEAIKHE